MYLWHTGGCRRAGQHLNYCRPPPAAHPPTGSPAVATAAAATVPASVPAAVPASWPATHHGHKVQVVAGLVPAAQQQHRKVEVQLAAREGDGAWRHRQQLRVQQ